MPSTASLAGKCHADNVQASINAHYPYQSSVKSATEK